MNRAAASFQAPLTAAQRSFFPDLGDLWADHRIAGYVRLRGAFDVTALEGALQALLARHDVLRAELVCEGEAPWQRVDQDRTARVQVFDVGDFPYLQREERARSLISEIWSSRAKSRVDSAGLEVRAIRIAPEDHAVYVWANRICVDASSMSLLINELRELYASKMANRAARLPDLGRSFVAHAAQQPPPQPGADPSPDRVRSPDAQDSRVQGPAASGPPSTPATFLYAPEELWLPCLGVPEFADAPSGLLIALAGALIARQEGCEALDVVWLQDTRPPEMEGVIGCFAVERHLRLRFSPTMLLSDALRMVAATDLDAQNAGSRATPSADALSRQAIVYEMCPMPSGLLGMADRNAEAFCPPTVRSRAHIRFLAHDSFLIGQALPTLTCAPSEGLLRSLGLMTRALEKAIARPDAPLAEILG